MNNVYKVYERNNLEGHQAYICDIDINGDGTILVSSSEDIIKIWNLATDKEPRTIPRHKTELYCSLAVSSNGKTLVSLSGDTIKIWDLARVC